MTYTIKWAQEAAWAVGIACAVFLLTTVGETEAIDDWRTWLVALGGGLVRVAAAVLLNEIRKIRSG